MSWSSSRGGLYGRQGRGVAPAVRAAARSEAAAGSSFGLGREGLCPLLQSLEGQQYGQYHRLEGGDFEIPGLNPQGRPGAAFAFRVTHVQADPFASPSDVEATVPADAVAPFFAACVGGRGADRAARLRAVADCFYRRFYEIAVRPTAKPGAGAGGAPGGGRGRGGRSRGGPGPGSGGGYFVSRGGSFHLDKPSQHVLTRSAVRLTADAITLRFQLSLPGRGRRIEGFQAADLVCTHLPRALSAVFSVPVEAVAKYADFVEDQAFLRKALAPRGLAAFVPDGAVLPRLSGACDLPLDSPKLFERRMARDAAEAVDGGGAHNGAGAAFGAGAASGADAGFAADDGASSFPVLPVNGGDDDFKLAGGPVPFASPPSLRCAFQLPHGGELRGMGVPRGVTLIVGGGFHGKSTLLRALQFGIYDKVPGDGREFVAVSPSAVKVRAEDGRPVGAVDLSLFIRNLPGGRSTENFSTTNASGSTSQAASVIEALDCESDLLLFDEDTSATNFMVRTSAMAALVREEPIFPYLGCVRSLFADAGVSSIIVVGSCGEYLAVADVVIQLKEFRAMDVTERAREIAAAQAAAAGAEAPAAAAGAEAPAAAAGAEAPAAAGGAEAPAAAGGAEAPAVAGGAEAPAAKAASGAAGGAPGGARAAGAGPAAAGPAAAAASTVVTPYLTRALSQRRLSVPRSLRHAKARISGFHGISFNSGELLDLSRLEQFAERGQVATVLSFLCRLSALPPGLPMAAVAAEMRKDPRDPLAFLEELRRARPSGNQLAELRWVDLAASINRLLIAHGEGEGQPLFVR